MVKYLSLIKTNKKEKIEKRRSRRRRRLEGEDMKEKKT